MAETAVINASPLIFFSRGNHLELLRLYASEIWVPQPVAEEILRRGPRDLTAQAIKRSDWLIVQPVPDIPGRILEWRLGAGSPLP